MSKGALFLVILMGCLVVSLYNPVAAIDVMAPVTLYDAGYYRILNDVTSCPGNGVTIEGSNIIVDGNGHTFSGIGQNSGVFINFDNHRTNVTIKNLKVTKFANGIYINGDYGNILKRQLEINNCELTNNKLGIGFNAIYGLNINNNKIENNEISGIECAQHYRDGSIVISSNSIKNNKNFGINLMNTDYGGGGGHSIINNEISNSDTGILIGNHLSNTIQDNKIQNNNNGLSIGISSGNTIKNNLFNNPKNIVAVGEANTWNTAKTLGKNIVGGPYLGGNAWLQPDGKGFSQVTPDSNNDGICDAALIIGSGNMDSYPLSGALQKLIFQLSPFLALHP